MKITICELSEKENELGNDWEALKIHTSKNKPQLILLPELPFSTWIAAEKKVNQKLRNLTIKKHEEWTERIKELKTPIVIYSRPELINEKLYNVSYACINGTEHRKVHSKYLFPREKYFWEAHWFEREKEDFTLIEINDIKIGVLICTEIWFTEYARRYGREGIDILVCPRATPAESVNQWIRCGQTLAVISGAYCLSSNKSGFSDYNFEWGGHGWIAEPGTGDLIATTNRNKKFISADIDLVKSKQAKKRYPLYVRQ